MNCPKCGFDCPPDFDFCPRCATALQMSCPNCSFRAPAEFAFCPKCATALAAPVVAAEREAQALNNLGEMARQQGAYEEARAYYEQCQGIFEEIGQRSGVALALGNLAWVCIPQGQDGAAWEHVRRALQENVAIQDTPHTLSDFLMVAQLRARAGQRERAADLLGLALHHPASYSKVECDAQPVLEMLREELDAEQLEAALARGAELDLDQVAEEILVEG